MAGIKMYMQLLFLFAGGSAVVLFVLLEFHIYPLPCPPSIQATELEARVHGANDDAENTEKQLEAMQRAMHRTFLQSAGPGATSRERREVADAPASSGTSLAAAIPQRWRYWEYCGGFLRCPPMERYGGSQETDARAGERFLLFDSRGAGWNNERQSVELAFAMAFLWRRTLVLPEYLGIYKFPNDLWHVNDSFDVAAMNTSVKVMFAQDFIKYAKANANRFPGGTAAVARLRLCKRHEHKRLTWRQWPGWYHGLNGVAETVFKDIDELIKHVVLGTLPGATRAHGGNVSQMPQYHKFATKHRLRNHSLLTLSDNEAEATALYLPPRILLGNFYTHIFVLDPVVSWQLRSVVRRTLRVRPEYFAAAAAAMEVAGLKPGEFGAIHIRQGDFEKVYPKYYVDPANPKKFLLHPQNKNLIQSSRKLYVASKATKEQEHKMREIFVPTLQQSMSEPAEIHSLGGEVEEAAMRVAGHLQNWQGIVEMIICSQADVFVGSWASTFTGYIHRLRGYNPQITDKRFLYSDEAWSATTKLTSPSWAEALHPNMIGWMREWPEGFQIS